MCLMLLHFSDMLVYIPTELSYVGTYHLCVRATKWSSVVTEDSSVATEDSFVATKVKGKKTMTTAPVSHSNPKGKEKENEKEKNKENEEEEEKEQEKTKEKEKVKKKAKEKEKKVEVVNCDKREGRSLLSQLLDLEFKQLDFVVAFPKKKDWFYVMSQPNKCWTNEKSKQQSLSKYQYTTTNCFFKTYIDNASVVPEYENKIVSTIKGFSIPGGLSWHLTDEVYVPVNFNREFHWVLAVVVLKERCIKVYDSMSSSRTNRKLCSEIQKLSTLLPKYLESIDFFIKKTEPTGQFSKLTKDCGLFIAAYAEFLSDGLQVPSDGISFETLRVRYALLLWNYGILKARSGYVSNNEDPQRPRPKKVKFDENVMVTTIN
ncbi:hypothetical protein H5410_004836 [Solanum commersonii]|uniref:Ubiquitin-like protease family profile domain-containing protein n=1 Tax=Solanum commersonii TaxID=4109 RepID=A0A9J6A5G8_SOLCO|nr:hypothetical protein H5410_004836 [Solanum commersonii]